MVGSVLFVVLQLFCENVFLSALRIFAQGGVYSTPMKAFIFACFVFSYCFPIAFPLFSYCFPIFPIGFLLFSFAFL